MVHQSDVIERMQRCALKIIHGHATSYREALERAGLKRLLERRGDLIQTFAEKTYANPHYAHWFPENVMIDQDLRKCNIIR